MEVYAKIFCETMFAIDCLLVFFGLILVASKWKMPGFRIVPCLILQSLPFLVWLTAWGMLLSSHVDAVSGSFIVSFFSLVFAIILPLAHIERGEIIGHGWIFSFGKYRPVTCDEDIEIGLFEHILYARTSTTQRFKLRGFKVKVFLCTEANPSQVTPYLIEKQLAELIRIWKMMLSKTLIPNLYEFHFKETLEALIGATRTNLAYIRISELRVKPLAKRDPQPIPT